MIPLVMANEEGKVQFLKIPTGIDVNWEMLSMKVEEGLL